MSRFRLRSSFLFVVCGCLWSAGCSRDEVATSNRPAESVPDDAAGESAAGESAANEIAGRRDGDSAQRRPPAPGTQGSPLDPPSIELVPAAPADSEDPAATGQQELDADLPPKDLVNELAATDHRMRRLITMAARGEGDDPAEELRETIDRKLLAARRLIEHPEATSSQRTAGRRGELQALSHLASLGRGDVRAAEELERLANEYKKSGDASLRVDSQLVLIGFAIESLHHGKADAASRVLSGVQQLAAQVSSTNLPALMVMGQARQTLQAFGHAQEAKKVRGIIVERFAESDDPEVARIAADIAGSALYDTIEPLRISAIRGQDVAVRQWREAAEEMIDAAEDITTVRYLAQAALDLEVAGRTELAEATYRLLEQQFSDGTERMNIEAQAALEARQARQDVIGKVFNPDLKAVDGESMPFESFRGQIVLMPFWDTRVPQSLALLTRLRELRDASPGSIDIVGMNLDLEGTDVQAFVEASGIEFPSYRSESSPTSDVGNQVALRFGLRSFPFTVVVDRENRISAVALDGAALEQAVKRLQEQQAAE